MARPRTVPDADVLDTVLELMAAGGPKAVTFGAVAGRAGLAASSLAERHGTLAGMMAAAEAHRWDRIAAATDRALAAAPDGPRGAIALLKALEDCRELRPDALSADLPRALDWRRRMEAELSLRLGGGEKGRTAAAMLLALWLGRMLWPRDAGPRLRLREALRRLMR